MRASMSKKSIIIGTFLFLLLLLAGNASSEVEPIYAGWTVGDRWDDGSGTGSYSTILRSIDSGNTWTRQGVGQIADVKMYGVVAVDPYTVWVVGDPHGGYATIYHTTDGGTTWERKGSAADVPDVPLLKATAYGDSKVWAVGVGTILHTNDGGVTWTNQIPAEYEGIELQGVHTPDGTNVWVTSGDTVNGYALILKSTNAGLNWTRQSGGDVNDWKHILGISAVDADTAWAIAARESDMQSGVLGTTDGGATWTPQVNTALDGNEVCAVDASTVWAVSDQTISWSSDGGESWGHYPSQAYTMGISAVSSQEAWAVRGWNYDNAGTIYHTADGGSTWTMLEELDGETLPNLWTISFATRPINDYLIELMDFVVAFVEDGYMNKGQGNALIVKLEHALDHLINDRRVATVNVLGAFSNQVEAFIQAGILPSELGYLLIDRANDFIELIGSSL